MKKPKIFSLMGILVALLGLTSSPPAQAAQNGVGVYLLGVNSSMAGYLPPPGVYGRMDFYWYQGNARILPLPGTVEANVRNRLLFGLAALTYVTPLQFNEINYGVGILWPFIGNNFLKGQVDVAGVLGRTAEGDYTGVGDLIIQPLLLGWHSEYFHVLGVFEFYVPVGSFNPNRSVNIGLNRWAVEPCLGVTFLHPKYGMEASVFMGYTVNFVNSANDYRTGNEFHLEYFVGQHLPKGFALGLAGYYYQQVTGDSGAGAVLGPFKGTTVALGPCLTYNTKIAGYPVGVNVRYYNELYVKNRLDGQSLFVTLTGGFPQKK